jgi:hypothetical protein
MTAYCDPRIYSIAGDPRILPACCSPRIQASLKSDTQAENHHQKGITQEACGEAYMSARVWRIENDVADAGY